MPNSWDHGNSSGCRECGCDPLGSEDLQCDRYSGLCRCKAGRGGAKCDQCSNLHYGDPTKPNGCKKCTCNPDGSTSPQCDRRSGRCFCVPGVEGEKCDRCARGTRGQLPYCESCGECWINWDRSIQELKNQTATLRTRAQRIAERGGLTGNFGDELANISVRLRKIERILRDSNVTASDVADVRDTLAEAQRVLEQEKIQPGTVIRVSVDNKKMAAQSDMDGLQRQAQQLQQKLQSVNDRISAMETDQRMIKSTSPEANYQAIMRNQQRSRDASTRMNRIGEAIKKTGVVVASINNKLDLKQAETNAILVRLNNSIMESSMKFNDLRYRIPQMNERVCGGNRLEMLESQNFCHLSCGGGGCSECGLRTACKNSLVSKPIGPRHPQNLVKQACTSCSII